MKANVNLKALKINGHDPRLNKAFLLLSSELSDSNGALSIAKDWKMLESKCFQLYQEQGYDLQSGVWFCLISMRLNGWAGLAQSLELFTTALVYHNQRCWPLASAQPHRQQLIDWLCINVGNRIYTLEYYPQNNADMRKVERGIGFVRDYAKSLSSRSHDALNNLHYFLQIRCRSLYYVQPLTEPSARNERPAVVKDNLQPETLPDIGLPQWTYAPRPWLWALSGLVTGMIICTAAFIGWHFKQQPMLSETLTAPIAQFQHSDQLLENVWRNASEQDIQQHRESILKRASSVLSWLNEQPNNVFIRQGEALSHLLDINFPDNRVSVNWRRGMQEKADSIPAMDGFINAVKRLDKLEMHLLNSERSKSNYITVSELKTIVYELRKDLQSTGIPAETLLWEINQQRDKDERISPSLLKQAERRINALSAKYLLLQGD